jgi:hypothetical protein
MTATRHASNSPRTATAAALAALLALYAAHALYYWTLTDDAYIYFRYAENWASGFGPVFNVGERVEGYGGILWLALLTALRLLGRRPEATAPAIGVLCGAVTLVLTFAIGRRAAPERHWAWSLIAPFLLAANRTFVAWSTGGLETALFTLLTTAAFARLFAEKGEAARPWSALLFALAALTRPEGMLFLAVGAAVRAATSRRRFAQWLVLALGPVAAHEAFRLAYYHAPLPNTFYAKVPGTRWDLGAAYLAAFLLEYAGFWLLPLAVLSWGAPAWRAERTRGGLLWAGAALYLLYVAAIGGDHFEFRFMHVLLPAICLAAQEGVFVAADKLGRTPCRRAGWGRALTLLTAAAAALLPATVSRDWDEYPVMLRPSALAALPAVGRLPGFHAWFTAYDRAYERAILSAAAVRVEEGRLFWRKQ